MRTFGVGIAAFLMTGSAMPMAVSAPLSAASPSAGAERCTALAGRELPGGVKISSASHKAAAAAGTVTGEMGMPLASALPAHCLVEGVIGERTNAAGKSFGIGFQLALPDGWNGRFLLMGGGGLNGTIRPPYGPVAAGSSPALARGFAVASHDSGHKGAVFDASFNTDQRAALDFAEASVRTVTLASKAITSEFYGSTIGHSYMTGCSTGGREGMLASQRYPELFDGIVVGAPAMMTGHSNLGIQYSIAMLNRAAPLAEDGLPDVSKIFSAGDRDLILKGMLKQCDGLDGLEDGMIMNVAQCRFEPAQLQCKAGKQEGCLSEKQVEGMHLAFAGPKDAAGYPLYHSVPYDTGIVDTAGPLPGYLPTGSPGVFGPAPRTTSIDLDKMIWDIRADAMQRLTDTHVWTNLNTFFDKGSKIIFYHGVSDPWFSANATWDYFQRARETNGAAWDNGARFYMNPGMAHCAGGNAFDQFDLLTPLVDWVEKGKAPESRPIVATRLDRKAGERPLCPHPQYPRYVSGDPNKASSFRCTAPES